MNESYWLVFSILASMQKSEYCIIDITYMKTKIVQGTGFVCISQFFDFSLGLILLLHMHNSMYSIPFYVYVKPFG